MYNILGCTFRNDTRIVSFIQLMTFWALIDVSFWEPTENATNTEPMVELLTLIYVQIWLLFLINPLKIGINGLN